MTRLIVNDYQMEASLNADRAGLVGNAVCRLYTNDYYPQRDSVIGDFTEAAWTGYAPTETIPSDWTPAAQDASLRWYLSTTRPTFTNLTASPVTAYGGYATDPDDATKVLFAARFSPAVTLPPGGSIVWRITYQREPGPTGFGLLWDTFTDANGTALQDHTPEVGGPWVMLNSAAWSILDDAARCTAGGFGKLAVCDVGEPDVATRIRYRPTGTSEDGIACRVSDASNYWVVDWPQSINAFRLFRVLAGSAATVSSASYTMAAGQEYVIEVRSVGSVISLTVNGAPVLSYTGATDLLTATKVGIMSTATSTQGRFEEVQAYQP